MVCESKIMKKIASIESLTINLVMMAILVKTKNIKLITSFSTADYKEQRQMMAESAVKIILTTKNPKFILN